MFKSKKIMAGLFLSSALFAGGQNVAFADNTTATMNITLEISPGCRISYQNSFAEGSTGTIAFKNVIGLDKDYSANIPLYISCSAGQKVSYTISMDKGRNFQNGTRNLAYSTHFIPYKICTTADCSTLWGDGTAGVGQPFKGQWDGTTDNNYKPQDVWAVVPAQPGVALYPGTYSDTVTAQITMN